MPEFSVTVTPYEREGSNIKGLARIYADDIYYVNRKEYVDWAVKALTVIRSVWNTFPGEGESEWRESAHKEFIKAGITPKNYLDFVCSKKVVVNCFGRKIDANIGIYKITGNPELLNILYQSGIGSRRSEGHGKWEVLM